MNNNFASLCLLSFERPTYMVKSVVSLRQNAGYPYELIVHDDGSGNEETRHIVKAWCDSKTVSYALMNCGNNMGVGHAANRCFYTAHGRVLAKLDADLEYSPGWLKRCMEILDTFPEVGALGLFDYGNVLPVDHPDRERWDSAFIKTHTRNGVVVNQVKDFVGSAILFRRDVWDRFGPWPEFSDAYAEDVEFKQKLVANGLWLALPQDDLATNFGFGFGRSTVVEGTQDKHNVRAIHKQPRIFNAENK